MFEKKFVETLLCLVVALALSATATMGADILFITALNYDAPVGDDQSMVGDDALKAFLESLGHTVTFLDDDEDEATTEAAAAAADAVFISETVSSGNIKNEITEVPTLMVVAEPWAWDEMGLTEGSGSGTDVATTDIEIVEPGHFLAAGLSGTVPVLTDITGPDWGTARFGMGIAGPEATVIATATLSDGQTYDFLFVYEKGAKLAQAPADGSPQVAADIRVCLGFDVRSYHLWNENAYALFEAAINYALGLVGPQSQARLPKPNNGAVDVDQEAFLSWKAGDYAATHNVYFGKVAEDVNAADPANPLDVLVGENQTITAYDPNGLLDFGETYYWRVDEINDLEPNSPWIGNLWSFTVINYFVVDDFEGYTDYAPDDIFSSWLDGYGIDENGALVGHDNPDFDADEHFLETEIVHGDEQSLPYFYNNAAPATHSEATLAFSEPQDWTREGVAELSLWFKGNPLYTGSFVEAPVGTYTMTGSGADIWNTSDEFHFAYKEFTGAGTIIAKVESIDPVNSNNETKVGVMIRNSLDPGSANTALLCTLNPEKGLRFQNRSVLDDSTVREDEDMDPNAMPPYWLKLQLTSGGLVRAYRSPDGVEWAQFNVKSMSIEMPMYIGLAVTSHDAALTTKAVFSNVSFPGTIVDMPWTNQDIGMLSNEPEPMYVILDGSAKVYHDDPDAALTDAWTEWVIPLEKFAEQGTDLTGVNSIGIGLGDKDNPQQDGGSGNMFFDDILLYLSRTVEPEEIVVENFSFELPGTEKIKGWNGEGVSNTPAVDIPGWSSDTVVADSGVETGYTATDGDWTAFLMSGDPSVWQLTDYSISDGEVLELKVDARITWAATAMQITLYYDDNGTRVPAATDEVTLTDDMQEYTLSLSAADVPGSVGKNIGIEFSNASTGDTWIGLDNIRLVVSSE
jgi:hypothetical protein